MEAYQRLGNISTALSYATRYAELKDSIHTKAQQATVAGLTEQYESEKKQQQIDLLNTQNELNQTRLQQQRFLTGGLGFFLLIFGGVWVALAQESADQAVITYGSYATPIIANPTQSSFSVSRAQ